MRDDAIQIESERPVDGAPHARCLRITSPGGVATTVHVSRFGLTDVAVEVVSLSPPQPLAEWCDENGVRQAITAGHLLQLAELAELMVLLDAHSARNLDGGASTALIASGRLQNTPRTDDGEPLDGARPTPTAILFRAR
jgi:hypothetical protein